MTAEAGSRGPMSGIRVVDLTSMVMGPYATQIMADLGADVIKIEPPAGDQTRYISDGPSPSMSGIFLNVNRGKRSVVLDLTREVDKAVLRSLIGTADVFIHSMRAKAIGKLGFDYKAVSEINPEIVYTNCYGYGRRGPEADLPAYDDTMQAECGLPYLQALKTGTADFVATILADKVSGLTALYATMMGLFHKLRTGEGQEIEVAMFETMASFVLVEHANMGLFDPPAGPANYPRVISRNRKPYRTKDGHIAALVYNDKHWNAFMSAVQPSWASAEFASLRERSKQVERVYALLSETFLERTTQQWLTLLRELHIPAAPLRTTEELFDNAHLNAVDFFETVDSPYGNIRFPGIPTWFSKSPGKIKGSAPELGAHTGEVLSELGFAAPSAASTPQLQSEILL